MILSILLMEFFRRTTPSLCPKCGSRMNYNGHNTYRKASFWAMLKLGGIFVLPEIL